MYDDVTHKKAITMNGLHEWFGFRVSGLGHKKGIT